VSATTTATFVNTGQVQYVRFRSARFDIGGGCEGLAPVAAVVGAAYRYPLAFISKSSVVTSNVSQWNSFSGGYLVESFWL
jgi:hypothetical protein